MTAALMTWKAWLSKPFSPDVTVLDWILLTIFAATLSWLWTRVLEDQLTVEG